MLLWNYFLMLVLGNGYMLLLLLLTRYRALKRYAPAIGSLMEAYQLCF